MASLKEIKGHIVSVKSTLKITSAMKLVSSAKLHKYSLMAQPLQDYRTELENSLAELGPSDTQSHGTKSSNGKTLIIAFGANSSLCGGYNAFIIKKAKEIILPMGEDAECIFIGKKLKEAMTRCGIRSGKDLDILIEHPSYQACSELADEICQRYLHSGFSSVKLLYTHYISTGRQEILYEDLLPATKPAEKEEAAPVEDISKRLILEPDQEHLRATIEDKLLKIKVYAALIDSLLSENAARTVAMQTATDNAHNLLDELTLEYNKGRQAKITSEILDLAGGALE